MKNPYSNNNKCPDCGKLIMDISKYCTSCCQKGKRNHQFIEGDSLKKYFCKDCGKEILYGNIRCRECYIKFNIGKNNRNFKGGLPHCIDCGKKLSTRGTISDSPKRCTFCSKQGKNSPNWIDGRSYEDYPKEFNKLLRELIRKRDNYTCQKCGVRERDFFRKLDVHHIDYNKKNCNKDNLITLCLRCNNKANGNRNYWYSYFKYIMENK